MALTCTINSDPALPKVNSVNLEFDAGQRSTLSLVVEDGTGAYDPIVGWPVTFSNSLDSTPLRFGGTIANIERGRLDESTSGLRYNITATGWENRLDKRFVGTSVAPYGVFVYAPITFTAAVSNVLTATAHSLVDGYAVQVWSTGTLPAPLVVATTYYVVSAAANTLKLSATPGGAEIDITDVGTGEHELKWMAGSVVKHALANWCGSEQITAGTISNGAVVEKIICDWKRVSELFDDLATASTYLWYITPAKVFNFIPRTATAGTYNITDASKNFRALKIKTDRSQYWNRGMRRVAWAAFGKTKETLTCDGVVTSWLLDHNVAVMDKITLNGVDQTIGERWVYSAGTKALATGSNFYYDPGMRGIWQDTGDALLQAADVPVVTYRELGRDVVTVGDDAGGDAERVVRAGVEGGSGDYGHFTDDSQNVDALGAYAVEAALLAQHQAIPLEISWEADSLETNSGDLRPGVLITLDVTGPPAVAGTFLITSVMARDIDGVYLVYTINATDKTVASRTGLGLFEEFMGAVAEGGGTAVSGPPAAGMSYGVIAYA